MSKPAPFGDLVQPFRIEALGLRGQLVRLGPALEAILGPHGYPATVAGMVAETLALAAVLANALRFEGIFTLQAQGDGPLGMLVADVTNTGDMRSYARFDGERIAAARGGAGGAVPSLFGAGHPLGVREKLCAARCAAGEPTLARVMLELNRWWS